MVFPPGGTPPLVGNQPPGWEPDPGGRTPSTIIRKEAGTLFSLNYRDARPIYEQVKDGLRHLVVTGAIQEGDQFPSVRALAASLAINPNTIQRAYESLEREGYLYTIAGKGAFAARRADVAGERRERLLRQFDEAATELLFLGLTAEELAHRVTGAKEGAK